MNSTLFVLVVMLLGQPIPNGVTYDRSATDIKFQTFSTMNDCRAMLNLIEQHTKNTLVKIACMKQ